MSRTSSVIDINSPSRNISFIDKNEKNEDDIKGKIFNKDLSRNNKRI
jgi:hypothetical protein